MAPAILGILASLAPSIGKAISGPLAGAAYGFIAEKFGLSDATKETVENFLSGLSGDNLVRLRELDHEFRMEMAKQGVTLALAQVDLNKEEAKNPSRFIAGWRPAAGWTAVIALFLTYVPKAVVLTLIWTVQAYKVAIIGDAAVPQFPELGVTELIGLLVSMLGIGAMRSIDKFGKVDTKEVAHGKS